MDEPFEGMLFTSDGYDVPRIYRVISATSAEVVADLLTNDGDLESGAKGYFTLSDFKNRMDSGEFSFLPENEYQMAQEIYVDPDSIDRIHICVRALSG